MSERELQQISKRLLADMKAWAIPIGDSDADAFDWEVREPGEDGQPRLKFLINPAILEPGVLAALLNPAAVSPAVNSGAPAAVFSMPVTPPLVPSTPPPLAVLPPPMTVHQYHLGINGQQFGPFVGQQIGQMFAAGQIALVGTKVWRIGLVEWVDLGLLPELAPMLQNAQSSVPPPLV